MKSLLLLLPLFFIHSSSFQPQTDTVAAKINKIPFKHVDALAKFTQGDFKTYISRNLQYNHRVSVSIKGQIVLLVSIGADGNISHVEVLKSLSPKIDQEVVRVINASPKWQPAVLNDQKVSMDMVFNIDIAINEAKPPVMAPVPVKPVITQNKAATITPANKPVIVASKMVKPGIVAKRTKLPPIKKTIPLPVIKKPVPPIAKKIAPLVIKKPAPPVAKKVLPPVIKKPVPVVAKKITPPVIKKPAPPIAKKVLPPVIKKPVPVVAKKIAPPVIKKPAPPVAKVILPVVKKPVPPVVKKPTPPIAKVIPPVIKKPAPSIAKVPPPIIKKAAPPIAKVVPPVVKKPNPPIVKKPALVAKNKVSLKKAKTKVIGDSPVDLTSSMPEFPGGTGAFGRYLNDNIVYPPNSRKNSIEGRVNISFVIEPDGSVSDVSVINSPAEDLSQEAIRVLLASPKWKPGIQNKTPVSFRFTIPINFSLVGKK